MGLGAPLFKAGLLISVRLSAAAAAAEGVASVSNTVSRTLFFAALKEEACILMELFISFLLTSPLPPLS